MSNILVTGGNGQLGSELKELAGKHVEYTFYFTDSIDLDITNHILVKEFIIKNSIKVIINCAAHTAVDTAETEFELSDAINHLAVCNFAEIAKEQDIQLIHISTDYVFDGQNYKPYVESDLVRSQSVYGETKLAGETSMLKINPQNSIIIRTSWVYSSHGNNFVKTMLRLGSEREQLSVISDQVGTPTYARDLAKTILDVLPKLDNNEVEVFHFSNEGVCSWYDFAKAIFEIKGLPVKVIPIQTFQYPTPAKRPFYSVLNKSKIKEKYKVDIPYWKESLTNCLNIL